MKCLACGADRDLSVGAVYPYPDDDIDTEEPLLQHPLLAVECSPRPDRKDRTYRMCVVCHECWHKLSPDMWIGEGNWESLHPVTPFEKLPKVKKGPNGYVDWDVSHYQ